MDKITGRPSYLSNAVNSQAASPRDFSWAKVKDTPGPRRRDRVDLEFGFGVSLFRAHSWSPWGWSGRRTKAPSYSYKAKWTSGGGTQAKVARAGWWEDQSRLTVSGLNAQGPTQLPRSLQWASSRALGFGARVVTHPMNLRSWLLANISIPPRKGLTLNLGQGGPVPSWLGSEHHLVRPTWPPSRAL